MKKVTNYTYLSDASIRIDNLTLRPWPDYTVVDGDSVQINRIVAELLISDDPLAHLWRAKIPEYVLLTIQKFPRCLWHDLLEVSQLHPDYFVQWSQACPALIGLMANHEAENQSDRDLDRVHAFYRGRKPRMQILGLPPTKEVYRILAKLPFDDCFPAQLEQLRIAVQDQSRRKLMRHLDEITTETLDTLQMPIEYLDINLLNMRPGDQMPPQCESVTELCREIAHFRQVTGKLPLWPYRGAHVSIHHLIQARNLLEIKLALGKQCRMVQFPEPPLVGIDSSKLQIEPLTTVRTLFKEGNEMGNCVMTYTRSILDGNHFAYRMTHPARATILLVKNLDDWYPVEIRGPKNVYSSAQTVDLVHAWAGTIPAGKEVSHDFPF